MSSSHTHHHDHRHGSETPNYGNAFLIGISLNLVYVVIEGFYGLLSHSVALMADAGHNLSDVLGLALAWAAMHLATKKPNARFSYGLKSTSILAALFNAVLLLVAVGGILWESVQRIFHPNPIQGNTVMIVAAVGIVINGVTALLFASGKKADINIRGAFLHMVSDALVSLGVVIAGYIYIKTGWEWIDPVVSIAICFVIVFGTLGLLKESFSLSLHGVPVGINLEEVRAFLETRPEVCKVHDLHVWAMSTTETALSCHLVSLKPDELSTPGALRLITDQLEEKFHISHATVQVDHVDDEQHCVQD